MNDLTAGTDLSPVVKSITQQIINRYAAASKDYNPIHIDEQFARKTVLGGTIAHGMLVLSYISQMLMENFGESWITGGKMGVRFKTPARPGDRLTISGKIESVDKKEDLTLVNCQIKCVNQKDEVIIIGEARVKIAAINGV